MKHFIKSLFAIMALLLTTTSAWAEENENKFKITYLLNDVDQKNATDKPGTVVCVINGTTATLTVTPKEGNYFETNGITVYKNINGINAQAPKRSQEAPDFNTPIKLTLSSSSLTGDTKFTFEVTDEKYEYEVYVNFKTRTSITGADITLDKDEYPYTGEEIKPTITKVELSDGTVLTTDDYTVKGYANNTNVPKENDPAPKITITGTGKYKDEASTEFTIVKAEINPVVEIKGWIYGETSNTPSIKKGGNPGGGEESFEYKEKDASDDKYTGDVPTNANTYIVKATVAATPNYKGGTATAEFTISPKSIAKVTIKLNPESFVFNGEDQRPEVTSVTDNALDGVSLIRNKDYTLTYESGTNVGEYSVTITGMGNYDSNTTASQKYNITALKTTPTVTLADTETPIVYDGTKKEPAVKVTVELKEGDVPTELTTDDYDVEYSDNVNAGENTAKATVTLKRNYTGSNTASFTIKPKSIADVTIEDIAAQSYTGKPIEPTVTVKDGEKTLTLNTDYTVSYSNNIDAALATAEKAPTVTITGKGNYDSKTTATKTFTITQTAGSIAFAQPAIEKTYGDEDFTNTVTVTGDGDISYSVANPKIASVNAKTGVVSVLRKGTTTITATLATGSNYKGASTSFTLTVNRELAEDGTGRSITRDADGYHFAINENVATGKVIGSEYDKVASLEYTRTLRTEGKTAVDVDNELRFLFTLCVPFDPRFDARFYTLAAVNGQVLRFEEKKDPNAFTPYLVAVTEDVCVTSETINVGIEDPFLAARRADATPDEISVDIMNLDFNHAINHGTPVDGYQLKGTLRGLTNEEAAAEGAYIMQNSGTWGAVKAGNEEVYIPLFRAYIVAASQNAQELNSSFDGSTTAIRHIVTVDSDGTERWYDLNGRRIERPATEGIYIHNGKKVAIK
jgi:hypothetical protein